MDFYEWEIISKPKIYYDLCFTVIQNPKEPHLIQHVLLRTYLKFQIKKMR